MNDAQKRAAVAKIGDLVSQALQDNEGLAEYLGELKDSGIVVHMVFEAGIQLFEANEHCPVHGAAAELPRMSKRDAKKFDQDFAKAMRIEL